MNTGHNRSHAWTLGCAATLGLALAAGAAQAQTVDPRVPQGDGGVKYLPGGKVRRFQGFMGAMPVWEQSTNVNSAKTISVDDIQAGGGTGYDLSGAGQTVAVFEVGGLPMYFHSEFGGRVGFRSTAALFADETIAYTAHATHVTGTIAAQGMDASAKGMAPSVQVYGWDTTDVLNEMVYEAGVGTKLSNHSWGVICGYDSSTGVWRWYGDTSVSSSEDYKFGYYTDTSKSWDEMLYAYPYHLPVVSAGNDRVDAGPGTGGTYYVYSGGSWVATTTSRAADGGSTGYDTLPGGIQTAKNTLTVGAVGDIAGGYSGPTSVAAASFTSFGPTDDGRIKPDVVANGVWLYSTNASYGSGTAYTNMSGTSMSAPSATGALALLHQQLANYFPGTAWFSSTLKGLVIHIADEAGSYDGPDYQFGYGLINARRAAEVIDDASGGVAEVLQNGYTGSTQTFALIPTGGPIRVTLCYLDQAGSVPSTATLDPTTKRLTNDLDATVIRSWVRPTGSGVIYYRPWCLNPASPSTMAVRGDNDRDNVEVIDVSESMMEPIGAGAVETWTLQITHEKLKSPTTAYRTYSLIITGARIP